MILAGQVALVTGAGGGIGRAIAFALAGQGARVGVNVAGNLAGGEATLRAIRDAGGDGVLLPADISDRGAVKLAVDRLAAEFGPVSILVNNSGIGSPRTPDTVLEIAAEDWDRVVAVNLTGALHCAQAVLPGMIGAGSGAIVNIASIRGITAARGLAAYGASKGGLIALSQQMAVEYARNGIRVNVISPGFVESEMFAGYINRQNDPAAARARFSATAALNRTGLPEEIAQAVIFLASSEASFVTGANLVVDGGNMANALREFL